MKRVLFLLLAFLLLPMLEAQGQSSKYHITESGSYWYGDHHKFAFSGDSLLLNDSDKGKALLLSPLALGLEQTWEYDISMQFNPSSSNYLEIFLLNSFLEGKGDGLTIRLGDSKDRIQVMEVINDDVVILSSSPEELLSESKIEGKLKIEKRKDDWQINWTPHTGASYMTSFQYEAPASAKSSGIHCVYTKTRADKFIIFPTITRHDTDTTPIQIDSLSISTAHSMELFFSKALHPGVSAEQFKLNHSMGSAENLEYEVNTVLLEWQEEIREDVNYTLHVQKLLDLNKNLTEEIYYSFTYQLPRPQLDTAYFSSRSELVLLFDQPVMVPEIGSDDLIPLGADILEMHQEAPNNIILKLGKSYHHGERFSLHLNNVLGMNGFASRPTEIHLLFKEALLHDLLISEIMADPSPSRGLPEVEYLELYNNTSDTMKLDNWRLGINSNSYPLQGMIAPKAYILLVNSKYQHLMQGNICFIQGFQIPNLSHEEHVLSLYSDLGKKIHQFKFGHENFTHASKEYGGWAISLSDLDSPCPNSLQFAYSKAIKGGTPNAPNNTEAPRPTFPERFYVKEVSYDYLNERYQFKFNRDLDSMSIPVTTQDISILQEDFQVISGVNGKQTFSGIRSCDGDVLNDTLLSMSKPQLPVSGNVCVSELLFDPYIEDEAYLELYNRSEQTIDARDLRIGTEVGFEKARALSDQSLLIPGGSFLLLTKNLKAIDARYRLSPFPFYLYPKHFPSLPNEGGELYIYNVNGDLLEYLSYGPGDHNSGLNNKQLKGIALERINGDDTDTSGKLWHSASSKSGYGTPGYQNSQWLQDLAGKSLLELSTDLLTPNNDGYNDILQISCNTDKAGYIGSLRIYNSKGIQVDEIFNNHVMGTHDQFQWAPHTAKQGIGTGLYLLQLELIHPDGNVIRERVLLTVGI